MKLSRLQSALFALVCSAGFLHADVVTLKDGKRLEGNILSETPQAIRMRYKLTPKIWDEKDILRTDIADGGILKQKPEEVEFIELKTLLPTVDLMSAEKYEQLIQDRLRPFVNRYPGTKEAGEVEKMLVEVQEEKEKVVAGGIKMEGRWLTPDQAKADSLNIKAYGLRAAMQEKVQEKDFNAALKEFDKLSDPRGGYVASIYYPKAVEDALAILTKYEAQIEQMIKDQPTLQKSRDESVKKLIEPDLSRMKSAIEREKELWKTTYELERKASKWFTPNKYDLPSLKALASNIITEKTRLMGIDTAAIGKVNEAIARLMRADSKAGQDADELKKMGEAILEGETAAAGVDPGSMQFYQSVFQAYRQRYAYAQQQLAALAAQQAAGAAVSPGVPASGTSAIAGTAAPGMDARVAAALAAAAGGTPAVDPAAAPGAVPVQGAPVVAPGTMPAVAAPPGTVSPPGMVPPGTTPPTGMVAPGATPPPPASYYPPPQVDPAVAMPSAEEEGMDTNTLLLIGMGVVLLVLLLTVVMGKKKK